VGAWKGNRVNSPHAKAFGTSFLKREKQRGKKIRIRGHNDGTKVAVGIGVFREWPSCMGID